MCRCKINLNLFNIFSEHFSLEVTDCHSSINSIFQIRLANRYDNQTRVKICLEVHQSDFGLRCLDSILVSKDSESDLGTRNFVQNVFPIDVVNIQPPKFQSESFNFDFWMK